MESQGRTLESRISKTCQLAVGDFAAMVIVLLPALQDFGRSALVAAHCWRSACNLVISAFPSFVFTIGLSHTDEVTLVVFCEQPSTMPSATTISELRLIVSTNANSQLSSSIIRIPGNIARTSSMITARNRASSVNPFKARNVVTEKTGPSLSR